MDDFDFKEDLTVWENMSSNDRALLVGWFKCWEETGLTESDLFKWFQTNDYVFGNIPWSIKKTVIASLTPPEYTATIDLW